MADKYDTSWQSDATCHTRPEMMLTLGALTWAGCATLVLATLIAPFFVPNYDRVADTISDLAAGDSEIIMDVALYGFAIGIMAVSLGFAHEHLGKAGWSTGVMSLAIVAGLVVIIGARNEYGDGDNEGVVIHIYLVYALGLLFVIIPATLFSGLRGHHPCAAWLTVALAVAWAIMAPVFLMSPTRIDGLLERILGLTACAMIATYGTVIFKRGRQHADTQQSA